MASIIRLRWCAKGAALAGVLLLALGTVSQGGAVAVPGEAISSAAEDLHRITGYPIEIRPSPRMALDFSLPLICQTVAEAFRSAAEDPETAERLGRLVHVVEIQDRIEAEGDYHVVVYEGVLTIQTLTGPTDVDRLRPLITEVLKKAAHVAAKEGR